jgi:Flp pilus assembly protein TadD
MRNSQTSALVAVLGLLPFGGLAQELDPKDAGTRDIRSVNVPLTDEVKTRIEDLAAEVAKNPKDPVRLAEYGYALTKVGRVDEGLSSLARAVVLAPDEPKVHLFRARGLWKAKDLEGAVESARKVTRSPLSTDHEAGEAFRILGAVYWEQGQIAEAEAALNDGLRREPGNAAIYANLGALYFSVQKIPQGLTVLDQAVQRGARDPRALATVARIYEGMGRLDLAKDAWAKIYVLRPDDVDVAQVVATHHFRDGEYEHVLPAIEKVVAARPKDAGAQLMYAQTLLRLGRFDDAKHAAEAAEKLGAADPAQATIDAIDLERNQAAPPK